MKNKEVVELLEEIADLLALHGETVFRVRAYQRVAQQIDGLTRSIEEIVAEGKLREIPGIGEGIAEKITEFINTGSLKYLEDLKKKTPVGLLEIMKVPGLGPKTTKLLYDTLKIKNLDDLERAAKEGKLHNLPHLGVKSEENIIHGISFLKQEGRERILLSEAHLVAEAILNELKKVSGVEQISVAGSLRRQKETVRDIDILCTAKQSESVMSAFVKLPQVKEVLAQGVTKSSVRLENGIQCDLRVVEPEQFGSALQYFTGSKEHNVALRILANKNGYTISEYGLFKIGDEKRPLAGATEESIYKKLGLSYIPPELRENRGEIEAAAKGKLPSLIELKDIKGDFHVHSHYSDGAASIETIGEVAMRFGLEWIVLADHSQSLKVAHGVGIKDLSRRRAEIEKWNSKNKSLHIFCGTELDILSDGSLDYTDNVLADFDFVIAAIHIGFKQSEEQITQRVIAAMENPYVRVIVHPTGRLINKREAYKINIEKILLAAARTRTAIEINAFPERLDLTDVNCIRAKQLGVKLAIGTDAHAPEQLAFMPYGVSVARRGWLEKKDVLNTFSTKEMLKYAKK